MSVFPCNVHTILKVRVMTGNFPFLGFYAMMNSGYISSPHNDIMFPHSFFSELGEKELSQAVNSDRSVQEIKVEVEKGFKLKGPGCFEKGINCPDYLNPLLVSQFMVRLQFILPNILEFVLLPYFVRFYSSLD